MSCTSCSIADGKRSDIARNDCDPNDSRSLADLYNVQCEEEHWDEMRQNYPVDEAGFEVEYKN